MIPAFKLLSIRTSVKIHDKTKSVSPTPAFISNQMREILSDSKERQKIRLMFREEVEKFCLVLMHRNHFWNVKVLFVLFFSTSCYNFWAWSCIISYVIPLTSLIQLFLRFFTLQERVNAVYAAVYFCTRSFIRSLSSFSTCSEGNIFFFFASLGICFCCWDPILFLRCH